VGHRFGNRVERSRLRRVVTDARHRSLVTIEELEAMEDEARSMPFPAATLRYGIAHERARLEWLDWLLDDRDSPLQQRTPRR
jgi:hypothetical protein